MHRQRRQSRKKNRTPTSYKNSKSAIYKLSRVQDAWEGMRIFYPYPLNLSLLLSHFPDYVLLLIFASADRWPPVGTSCRLKYLWLHPPPRYLSHFSSLRRSSFIFRRFVLVVLYLLSHSYHFQSLSPCTGTYAAKWCMTRNGGAVCRVQDKGN